MASSPPAFPDDATLMAYADQELDTTTAEAVDAIMAVDPAVRARVAMFMASAGYVQAAFAGQDFTTVPAALEQKIRRATQLGWARQAVRKALPMAAMVAGLSFGITQLPRMAGWMDGGAAGRIASVLHEVAEYHAVFVHETEHLVEVAANRQAHIEEWLGARVGYPLQVPDLAARGLTFVGARMLVVDARPVAQLMYTNARGDRVALCVTEQSKAGDSPLQYMAEQGFDLYAQGIGRHVFILAAPEGMATARALAAEMPQLMRRG